MNTSNQELIEKLPHKDSIRLIHRINSVDSKTAICETDVKQSLINLFPGSVGIDTCVGIELIAQSSAIPLIFGANSKVPMQGMLVQIKRFEAHKREISEHAVLTTKIELENLSEGTFTMAHGKVFCKEKLVCEGTITLAITSSS